MDTLNRETLIFWGVAVLLVNIIIAAFLKRRLRALNAIVTTIACIVVITGIAQFTLAAASANTANASGSGNFSSFAGPPPSGSSGATANADSGSFPSGPSTPNGLAGNATESAASSMVSDAPIGAANGPSGFPAGGPGGGQLPAALQTSIAQGTIPAPMQTRMASQGGNAGLPESNSTAQANVATDGSNGSAASGSTGNTSNANRANNQNSGTATTLTGPVNTANTPSAPSAFTALLGLARRYVAVVTIAGGLLILFSGMLFYASERQHETFRQVGSLGLLHMLVGVVIIAAMLGIPAVTAQASNSRRAAVAITPTNGPAPTRASIASATPTETLPEYTATPLPSLTPAPSETPIVLSTPITYAHAEQQASLTSCSVSALSGLNLRAEPAVNQMAIGKIVAGSLMKVTGKSIDNKWWRVISPDNVEGWVSADFVTPYSGCTSNSVPVVAVTQP
jgi:hypothetical protein